MLDTITNALEKLDRPNKAAANLAKGLAEAERNLSRTSMKLEIAEEQFWRCKNELFEKSKEAEAKGWQIAALKYRLAEAEGRKADAAAAKKAFVDGIDPDGFELLRCAEKLLGLKSSAIYETFYYEENRGYFEDMDGHQLLPYLEKCSRFFRIKSSEIVGSCYERCTYELDPARANEYEAYRAKLQKAYEEHLFAKAAA